MLAKDTVLSSVVKGNAYGHGIEVFVPLAERCGIRHFSVFNASEAERVVRSSQHPDTTVVIMGTTTPEEKAWAIEAGVELWVFNRQGLEEAASLAKSTHKPAILHLELETGLNRTGCSLDRLSELVEASRDLPGQIEWKGLATHMAGAESLANEIRIREQLKLFENAVSTLKQHGVEPKQKHTACSAAVIRYPEAHLDLVRVGIMQYGFWPSKEVYIRWWTEQGDPSQSPLHPVLTWRTHIAEIKTVKAGQWIGYGMNYMTDRDTKVAVLPIGYSSGFSRALSNQGRVLIRGQRCGVLGVVNMNLTMIKVTNLDHVEVGDEVVLIGEQGDRKISVSSFSELTNQLNYELLCRLPTEIPRSVL